MTRHIIGSVAFSGAVAAALVFGARTVVAAPAPSETAVVACKTAFDCRSYCQTYYPGRTPKCYGGRCECVLI